MDFESKIISREVSQLLWEMEKTLSTAESCTGGRIAEAIIAVPGASKYFKGGVISYVDEVKESLLGVSREVLQEKTAVCEEVAMAMVCGACKRYEGYSCRYHLAGLRHSREAGDAQGARGPRTRHQSRYCY